MKKNIIAVFALGLSAIATAQELKTPATNAEQLPPQKFAAHNKGKWFIHFGGNRDFFTKSDIHFSGNDYNFTLYDVESHDKPKGIHIDYFNPTRMTIPQTNFKIGYFFSDKYSISVGVDHMKYVMTQNQTVDMTGTISNHSPFDGTYNDSPTVLTTDFLKFEHTNGLNFVNAELTRQDDFSKYLGINIDYVQFNTVLGGSAGFLYPKTDVTLMGEKRHNDFHVAGYGVALKTGINITFLKHFYIQYEVKGGYINMPDIRTTDSKSDKASQHFEFIETIFAFGTIWKF